MPNAFPILRDGTRQLAVNSGAGSNFTVPSADNEPERNTYRAFSFGLAPTGAVNDLVALGGSATRLIRLKGVIVSGTATAATNVPIYIFKRTAVYAGGTPTAITRVSADTDDPASTATLVHYASAGATAGTGTMLDGCRLNLAPAANGGIALASGEFVALVNSDIELAPDWLERTRNALIGNPGAGSIATKMIDLADPSLLYDTGDFLRRDGATEQRGRFRTDDGRFDSPGEVWSACAGAALYRRSAVVGVGGFDERLFIYLEDVELGLRLRQAGWRCLYEPAVARHAGGGSERALTGGATLWVERNTIVIVAKHFPPRWIGPVLYRQAAWAWHHFRAGTLKAWLRGLKAGLTLVPAVLRERRSRPDPKVPIDLVIPDRPWRGPSAGGHPDSPE